MATNQKIDEQLILALDTSEEMRERTVDLNVGYNKNLDTWELIVKYNGSLDELIELGIGVEYLIAGYAIITAPKNYVDYIANLPQIEYIEKPKRFYFNDFYPAEGYCFPLVTMNEPFLTGEGVLVAILDSGIDYRKPDFIGEDGNSRILFLWDQVNDTEYTSEQITQVIRTDNSNISDTLNMDEISEMTLINSVDVSGHGTAVAGIAAGYNKNVNYRGIATKAGIIAVKLSSAGRNDFPRTTQIMRGVSYALQKANELARPLVINISLGNNYGPHDGTALLERFLDNASEIGKTVICVGAGNEGVSGKHYSLDANTDNEVEFVVGEYETAVSIQIWKSFTLDMRIELIGPSGQGITIFENIEGGNYTAQIDNSTVLFYYGTPTPYSTRQEIYVEIITENSSYLDSGVWRFSFDYQGSRKGYCDLYLTSINDAGNTGFVRQDVNGTFTVPSTAKRVITVAASDSYVDSYAAFSGRGFLVDSDSSELITGLKPDITAAGVDIIAPSVRGGYDSFTGTSFATPIVSGTCALLMEWGIIRGNDPYMYGEKLKAYLHKGAIPLRGEGQVPNNRVGFGRVCISNSII